MLVTTATAAARKPVRRNDAHALARLDHRDDGVEAVHDQMRRLRHASPYEVFVDEPLQRNRPIQRDQRFALERSPGGRAVRRPVILPADRHQGEAKQRRPSDSWQMGEEHDQSHIDRSRANPLDNRRGFAVEQL